LKSLAYLSVFALIFALSIITIQDVYAIDGISDNLTTNHVFGKAWNEYDTFRIVGDLTKDSDYTQTIFGKTVSTTKVNGFEEYLVSSPTSEIINVTPKTTIFNNQNNLIDKNAIANLQVPFVQNLGQIDNAVKFYADLSVGTAFVTDDGITYGLIYKSDTNTIAYAINEKFLGNKLSAIGKSKSESTLSSFVGDKSKWKTNIPTYDEISLGSPWNGIQVSLKAHGNNMEKIFTITPYANPGAVRMEIEGISSLETDSQGQLILNTPLGLLNMTQPIAYQEIDGKRIDVDIKYNTKGSTYGFVVGKYDSTHDLIIDPLLASTYFGGGTGGTEQVEGIAFDSLGNVYVAGFAASTGFPTTAGAYSTTGTGFVSKLSPDLTSLLKSTRFPAEIQDIALDSSNNVYIVGRTSSSLFPTTVGAYDTTHGGSNDTYISKLNSDLTSLLASTYLGGTGAEASNAIVIYSDNVYVLGSTSSTDFPVTLGAYDTTANGGGDAFISKLNSDLTSLLSSTYLGGSLEDGFTGDSPGNKMVLDSSGNVYLTGFTRSTNFPVNAGAYDTTFNGGFYDSFVSKLNSDLTSLLASTYLGGSVEEDGRGGIALDSFTNVYVSGYFNSGTFPKTVGAYDTTYGGSGDTYISKLNSELTSLLASTYLGGTGGEASNAIVIDSLDNVFATGTTTGNFPVTGGGYDTIYNDHGDAYISKLNSDLTTLLSSTYFGSTVFYDVPHDMEIDQSCNIYLAGQMIKFGFTPPDFPTTVGAYQTTYNGATADAFVSKFTNDLSLNDLGPPTFTAKRTGTNTIVLTFSENIDTTTVAGQGYTLSIGTVTANTDPAGCSNIMTLTTSGIIGTSATPTVFYRTTTGTTVDVNANEVVDGTSAVASDNVSPVFTAARTSPTTWNVIFSENVDAAANENSAWTISGGHIVTAVTDPNNTNTLTITAAASTGTTGGQTITYLDTSGTVHDTASNEVANGTSAVATNILCSAPLSENWIIDFDCDITSSINPQGNVDVQNGALVTIENGGILDIEFTTNYLKIHSGSGVLIKSGGKIN
jgi:hypothetical protein